MTEECSDFVFLEGEHLPPLQKVICRPPVISITKVPKRKRSLTSTQDDLVVNKIGKFSFIKIELDAFNDEKHSLIGGLKMILTWEVTYQLPTFESLLQLIQRMNTCNEIRFITEYIGNNGNDLIVNKAMSLADKRNHVLIEFDLHIRSLHNLSVILNKIRDPHHSSGTPNPQLSVCLEEKHNDSLDNDTFYQLLDIETEKKSIHDSLWYYFPVKRGQSLWYSPFYKQFTNKEPDERKGGFYIMHAHNHMKTTIVNFIRLLQTNIHIHQYESFSSTPSISPPISPFLTSISPPFSLSQSSSTSSSESESQSSSPSRDYSTISLSKDLNPAETTLVICNNDSDINLWKQMLSKHSVLYAELNNTNLYFNQFKYCQVILVSSHIMKGIRYQHNKTLIQNTLWNRVILMDLSFHCNTFKTNYMWVVSSREMSAQDIIQYGSYFQFPHFMPLSVASQLLRYYTINESNSDILSRPQSSQSQYESSDEYSWIISSL